MPEIRKVTELRSIAVNAANGLVLDIMIGIREGDAILGSRSHRQGIPVGADVPAFLASVSESLVAGVPIVNPDGRRETVSYPALSDVDIETVVSKAAEVWTAEVLAEAAFRAAKESDHA